MTNTEDIKLTAIEVRKLIDNHYQQQGNVKLTIDLANTLMPKLISRPSKPILPQTHNSDIVLKYSQDLKKYEDDMVIYRDNEQIRREQCLVIHSEIEDFVRRVSGINAVPEQYRDRVWSRAYEDSHSDGIYQLYLRLIDLIEIFT